MCPVQKRDRGGQQDLPALRKKAAIQKQIGETERKNYTGVERAAEKKLLRQQSI